MHDRRGRLRAIAPITALLALQLFAVSGSAHAFCRTTTVQKPATFSEVLLQQCFTDGKPLWWAGRCVGYSLQASGSKNFTFADLEPVVKSAVDAWAGVNCAGPNGTGPVSIDLQYLGAAACSKVEFRGDAGNVNVIVFRDDSWPADQDPDHVIALTTVQYNTTTGELRGVDMEINTAKQNINLDGAGGSIALPGVLTHEAGHMLGFAHSTEKTSTMYEKYNSSIGNLSSDDIAAVCTVYPPDGTRPTADGTRAALACDPTPPRGYVPDCFAGDSGGCSCEAMGSRAGSGGALVFAVALGALLRRHRSRR
ncbi:hypothetical protein BH09MYX1_BH09MYX1_43360 [soil metagenome]